VAGQFTPSGCAWRIKVSPISPQTWGLGQECCMGWIGQDSGKGIELQGKIMAKA